ncbi:hypothetical protein SUGI_0087500 [Cryptomeria japonica]|nr:hypothetical protein SUGI_0087500 [Cryptomeria japonica]
MSTLSPPSPLPETSSTNDIDRVTCNKFGLYDDAAEQSRENEVLGCCFLDSQGRKMKLLRPPLRARSVSKCYDMEQTSGKTTLDSSRVLKLHSKCHDKESISANATTDNLEKPTMDANNGIKVKTDWNSVEDVSCNEKKHAKVRNICGENEVLDEPEDRMAQCDKECSQILPYLFLGSRTVAQKLSTLHYCRITHILNCVGSICPESFPNDFSYRTLWLEDKPNEDLTCILYDVFDYIEEIQRQSGSRLFLHCCQGVSRSVALVIAYLMWKEHKSFDDAYAFVKASRRVASPNIGFVVQLMQWQSRIQTPLSAKIFHMYRLAPSSSYTPLHLVPKSVNHPSIWALDSRGVFIIQLDNKLYIWRGEKSDLDMAAAANRSAFQFLRYEHVKGPLVSCREGFESAELCEALGISDADYMQLKRKQGEISFSSEVGEKLVAEYDTDFELFWKAKFGGLS